MKQFIFILVFALLLIPTIVENVAVSTACPNEINIVDRSGCCSWHGGVCGCDGYTGKQVCCDGTLSPSCYCK